MSKNIEKLLEKTSKYYIHYLQHKILLTLMNDLCSNYNFNKTSPSSTYVFECKGSEYGIKLNFNIQKNDIVMTHQKLKISDKWFQLDGPSSSSGYCFVINKNPNHVRYFDVKGNDKEDNVEIIRFVKQMKKDIESYINENVLELKCIFRQQKIKNVLKDEV